MTSQAAARHVRRVPIFRRDMLANPGLSLPLGLALVAWTVLAGLSRLDVGMPLCLGAGNGFGAQVRSAIGAQWALLDPWWVVGWGAMVLAMMLPIAASHLSIAVAKTMPRYRWPVLCAAMTGYLVAWMLLGVPYVALFVLNAAVESLSVWPVVPLVTYGAAIAWSMTPQRRRALRRCHPVPVFFGEGRAQARAAGLWGARLAGYCASVCFLAMAAPMLSGQGLTGMLIVTHVLLAERRALRPEPVQTALPLGFLLVGALVI